MTRRALAAFACLFVQVVISPRELRAQQLKLLIRPRVPALVGPDSFEPAPVLSFSDARAELDGGSVTSDELTTSLRTLVSNYKLLRPDSPFNGKILVACEPETSTRRISEYLRLARDAGFPNPMFLLIQPNPSEPTDKSADRITTANASTKKERDVASLKVRDLTDCESLVKAVIAKRYQKKAVFLDLGDVRRPSPSAAQQGGAADLSAPGR
jgi:hypothetical protein